MHDKAQTKSKRPLVPSGKVGWKWVTKNRMSPKRPQNRYNPHHPTARRFGTILNYPKGRIVRATSWHNCKHDCCRGIHYYHSLRAAKLNRFPGYLLIKVQPLGRVHRGFVKSRAEAVKVLS